MAYNGFWISGRELQSVLKALIHSKFSENHIASHGSRIYVNGNPVTSVRSDVGFGQSSENLLRDSRPSSFEGIAHLEKPFTHIDTAVRKFKERLHKDEFNY